MFASHVVAGLLALASSVTPYRVAVIPQPGETERTPLTATTCTALNGLPGMDPSCFHSYPVKVLPRRVDEARRVLAEHDAKQTLEACTTPICFRVLGELLEVHYLVVPYAKATRSGLLIWLELVDTATGKTTNRLPCKPKPDGFERNIERAEVAKLLAPLRQRPAKPFTRTILPASVPPGEAHEESPTPATEGQWKKLGNVVMSRLVEPDGLVRVAWDMRGKDSAPRFMRITLRGHHGASGKWCVDRNGKVTRSGPGCMQEFPVAGETRFALPTRDPGAWIWLAEAGGKKDMMDSIAQGVVLAGISPMLALDGVPPASSRPFSMVPLLACGNSTATVAASWALTPGDRLPQPSEWKELFKGPCRETTFPRVKMELEPGMWRVHGRLQEVNTGQVSLVSSNVEVVESGQAIRVVLDLNDAMLEWVDRGALHKAIIKRAAADGIKIVEIRSKEEEEVTTPCMVDYHIGLRANRLKRMVAVTGNILTWACTTCAFSSAVYTCAKDAASAIQLSADVVMDLLFQAKVPGAKQPATALKNQTCAEDSNVAPQRR